MRKIKNTSLKTMLQVNREETKIIAKITLHIKIIGTYKIKTDIIQMKINKRKLIKETIINNDIVWKKYGKRTRCERKNNKEYNEEKDTFHSCNKSCLMIQTKNDTSP